MSETNGSGNIFGSIGENGHYYIAGAGAACVLNWIVAFYPAIIIGLWGYQINPGGNPEEAWVSFFLFALITYITIIVCVIREKYVFVVSLYVLCIWPFIHQIYWFFANMDASNYSEDQFPLPPVDWWPFW
jgi:hypothetical protein